MERTAKGYERLLFYTLGIVILVVYHIQFDLSFGDIVDVYGKILQKGSEYYPEGTNIFEAIWNFTVFHYHYWSSRAIIEAVLIVLAVLPEIVWHILDILSVVLIGYSLDCLVDIKDRKTKYLSIFTLMMMYRVITMRSAGWIATTMNYNWVLACGLYMLTVVKRIREQEKISPVTYVLSVLAALYAMDHEQMNVTLLIFTSVLFVKDIVQKKFSMKCLPYWVINIALFIYIMTCPGNDNRASIEIAAYFPEYTSYKFHHKVMAGIYSLLRGLFSPASLSPIVFACCSLMTYLMYQTKQKLYVKVISFIPPIYTLIYSIDAVRGHADSGWLTAYGASKRTTVLAVLVVACICFCCLILTMHMKEQIMVLTSLAAVGATKVALGFSIAFRISGERTSIYMGFCIILITLFLIEKYEEKCPILKRNWFRGLLCAINVLFFAANIWQLLGDTVV